MARLGRYDVAGLPQHVIQRGNNRQAVFFADEDYGRYRRWLADAAAAQGCEVHAYVLMTNHVHLLLTPRTAGAVGRALQSLGRRYVRYVNDTYRRSGTLWEGRYKATVVESERYLLACQRYIELNPVRAGLAADPADYPWSSYGSNGLGRPDPLVIPHPTYRALGRSADRRRANYCASFREAMDAETLAAVRAAVQQGWPLGGERFRTEIEAITGRRAAPLPRGRPRKTANHKENALCPRLPVKAVKDALKAKSGKQD